MSSEYGLFNSFRNRFIIVNDDYESLKYVQLLTMNHELLYLVDLTGIVNYRKGLLNNEKCMSVTVANGEKLRIEIDMYFTNPSYRLLPASRDASNSDIEYQKKMIFLFDFIRSLAGNGHHILERDLKQVENLKKGLRVFKKFMSMTLPQDEQIQKFIDREIANKDIPKKILEEFQSIVFQILYELDYTKSVDAIKQDIRNKVNAIPVSAYYFTESINKINEFLEK